MDNNPTLIAALAAAEQGWSVFPLIPGAKTPAVKRWEERATSDTKRITRCWSSGPYGIGIATGPSGLVVIDLDRPKPDFEWPPEWSMVGVFDGADVLAVLAERAGQSLPIDTLMIGTASGGTHLYFTAPAGVELRNTSGTRGRGLGPLIDTRACGGYVVGAGTVTAAGSYTVVQDAEVAPLPVWLVTALTPPPPPPPAPPVKLTGDRLARLASGAINRSVAHIKAAHEAGDGRKHAVFHAALTLGRLVAGGVMAETDADAALTSAGRAAGLSASVVRSAIRSGFRYGAQNPRHVEVTS